MGRECSLKHDESREDKSQADSGGCTGELEDDPDIGHHSRAKEDAADEEAGDESEPDGVMGERGGSREEDGVDVEAEGEVEQGEDQHDVHGVADADDDADEMGERDTEIGVEVGQDVVTRRVSEQQVAECGGAEVDCAAQEHRPSHHGLHLLFRRIHSPCKLICNRMHCSQNEKPKLGFRCTHCEDKRICRKRQIQKTKSKCGDGYHCGGKCRQS